MYALCYEQTQYLAGRTERIDIILAEFPTREDAEKAQCSLPTPAEYYVKLC